MGNCMIVSDDKNPECYLCTDEFKHRYIFCACCKKRVHYHCLVKVIPKLNVCYSCNSEKLQFIDNKEKHRTEESFQNGNIRNKRSTI